MEDKSTDLQSSESRIVLDYLKDCITDFQISSLIRELNICETISRSEPIIDVAVVGQFKAGKSSFLNSIIGEDILPVGVIPVTTVVTRIKYGDEAKVQISFFNGDRLEVSIDEIGEYVSEENNPANKKGVNIVDIEFPSIGKYSGLRFVDTPGLGSILKYNTETAEEWLPEVGAAIVAVSADRPLSEQDLILIKNLYDYTPRILLLLTKADLLKEEQRKKVITFFKESLQRELGRRPLIRLYSTVEGMETYRKGVEDLLLSLCEKKGEEQAVIFKHKVTSLGEKCLKYLQIAYKASEKHDSDREALKSMVLTEKLRYDVIRSDITILAREHMLQTRPLIASILNRYGVPLSQKLVSKLKEEWPSWKGNLWHLTRRFEDWLEQNIATELQKISKEEHRHFFITLEGAHSSISRHIELFRLQLGKNIEEVMGIRLSDTVWDLNVPEVLYPDIAFIKVFDFHIDLLWFLIPMCIFRRAFERYFIRSIPRVVEIHLSRLAYQWEVRINTAIEKMKEGALGYIKDELATIEYMLSARDNKSESISKRLLLLQKMLHHGG